MARASWKGIVLAESDEVIEIENSLYFPRGTVRMDLLHPSPTTTRCPWKGEATYYSLIDGEDRLDDAAWSYEKPKSRARVIKDYMAFWKQVTISG
jgi:uncharacterized protein (DUF427 family)